KTKHEKARARAEQENAIDRNEVSTYTQRITDLQGQLRKADSEAGKLNDKIRKALELTESADELKELERRRSALDREVQELVAKIALAESEVKRIKKGLVELGEKRRQIKALQEVIEVHSELGTALRADQFIRFVEEEAMERLAQDGTEHL